MKKLLIATRNKAKLRELKFGLQHLKKVGVKILSLNDLNIRPKPHETGKTFQENSKIKARFYGKLTGLPTVADDGGLVIPYLNNEPGVKSRRWLGYEASDEQLISHTLLKLKGVSGKNRIAYLETYICFFDPKTNRLILEGEKIAGHIADIPYGNWERGFPYRALLIVDKFNKYYDELTGEEHQQINHRLKALKRLVKRMSKYLIE